FGPGMFIAPAFLNQADQDHDGRLSREEFNGLAEKWFAAWDTNKTGKLDAPKIRAGLNASLGPPGGMGGPGGPGSQGRPGGPAGLGAQSGPGGPARPGGVSGPDGAGGPGGRGPGMMLQGAEGKRNGLASAMGIEFTYVHADLEFEGQLMKDVAIR